ncbi:MAG: curli assembly protein CsgF, partial [Alphaproteobacteria bacterium]
MKKHFLVAAVFFVFSSNADAQQLVYTPVTPAFGGSSFNYSYLQGTADAQNQFKGKKSGASKTSNTDRFIQMLQSRLYSGLAQKVSETLFGSDCEGSCSGEIILGDQTVSYDKTAEGTTL